MPKNKDLITCLTVKVIRMIDLRFFFPATENHDQDPANYEIHVMTHVMTPAALDFYWSMRHVVRGSGDQAALVVSVAHLLSLMKPLDIWPNE